MNCKIVEMHDIIPLEKAILRLSIDHGLIKECIKINMDKIKYKITNESISSNIEKAQNNIRKCVAIVANATNNRNIFIEHKIYICDDLYNSSTGWSSDVVNFLNDEFIIESISKYIDDVCIMTIDIAPQT